MARLVTFGCSLTYGTGLPTPNEQVWGSLLSKKLDREFVNKGIPGAGNKEIVHSLVNFDFHPDDLVCILWTFVDRYCVLQDQEKTIQFIPGSSTSKSTTYYKHIHEDYDHYFLFKVFIEYGVNLLCKNNIKVYSLFNTDQDPLGLDINTTLLPVYYGSFYNIHPKGIDNLHMGVQGNKEYADALYRTFIPKPVI
jgi:hypothetical protein